MGWVYLDDRFPEHPKVADAGGDAGWLFVCALAYTNRHAGDGTVPKSIVTQLSDRKQAARLARRLVEVGLWHDKGGHYEIHDYEMWNQQAMVRRAKARKAAEARWGHRGDTTVDDARSTARASPPSNAQASPEHMPEHDPSSATAMQYPKPQAPSPLAVVGTDSSSSTGCPEDDEEDPPNLETQAIQILAQRDRAATTSQVRNEQAWLNKAISRRSDQHAGQLTTLDLAEFTSPAELADHLDPPPAPKRVDPLEQTQAAQQAIYDRSKPCPTCGFIKAIPNPDGPGYIECPVCNPEDT